MSSQYFRFLSRSAEPRRSAFLEQLLARADGGRLVSDWRADAFRVIAPQALWPGVAPAALRADAAAVDAAAVDAAAANAAWVCLATPVHYVADMTSVRMPQGGILSLMQADAETLALDFNRVWNGSGIRLAAGASARLYGIFDQTLNVTTRDPEDVLERHIEEYLPAGADAPRLRQLMSEIEMWLFEHEVNSTRAHAGAPRVSGLWLWGGGAPLASLPRVQGWAAGDDVFFSAFKGEESGSGVIVASQAPGEGGWRDMESRWLEPAVAQLRAGRLSRLDLSAGERCVTLSARAVRRFWRRRKPWWEFFA
ncbi:MAG TPA: hypothetical protein VK523_05215 [Steroidobacteraceae bacterium]|nr:hypothetical protein [Steroidobacteraceae bacterium]